MRSSRVLRALRRRQRRGRLLLGCARVCMAAGLQLRGRRSRPSGRLRARLGNAGAPDRRTWGPPGSPENVETPRGGARPVPPGLLQAARGPADQDAAERLEEEACSAPRGASHNTPEQHQEDAPPGGAYSEPVLCGACVRASVTTRVPVHILLLMRAAHRCEWTRVRCCCGTDARLSCRQVAVRLGSRACIHASVCLYHGNSSCSCQRSSWNTRSQAQVCVLRSRRIARRPSHTTAQRVQT